MKLTQLYNINLSEITTPYDLYIGVAGIEPRSYYLLNTTIFSNIAKNKYVIPYDENLVLPEDYPTDVNVLKNASQCTNPIWSIVEDFLISQPNTLSIIIDYSSMTRLWYGEFLKSCNEYQGDTTLNLIFAYNMAQPESPGDNLSFDFSSMPGYLHINTPNKPVALIIGLGYEDGRAYSLKEFFDAEVVYIFRTSKSWSKEYYNLVTQNNEHLLDRFGDYTFEYSLDNISLAYKNLADLCFELEKKYRIIIAPCGPKPFTLISCLIFLRYQSVNIWRIKNIGNTPQKEPSNKTILTSITFSK